MLAFATRTWDGWDYIPHAWPVWLDATDGVLLVATAGARADGSMGTDAEGKTLTLGVPIAISRVAMLSATEGWVEGIRVDPRVRGMGVATDLQVAELQWLAAHDTAVVRYATGERNIGSQRLGARHGFALASAFRTWTWQDPAAPAESQREDGASAWDEQARADATARRRRALDRLSAAGLATAPQDAQASWQRVADDAVFRAASGLYELRGWTMQELTADAFRRHVAQGELLAMETAGGWAAAILVTDAPPAEDAIIHLSLVAGEPAAVLALASRVREIIGEPIRFRLPEALAASFPDETAMSAEGFPPRPWRQHILARDSAANELPPVDPSRLELTDPPRRVILPPPR